MLRSMSAFLASGRAGNRVVPFLGSPASPLVAVVPSVATLESSPPPPAIAAMTTITMATKGRRKRFFLYQGRIALALAFSAAAFAFEVLLSSAIPLLLGLSFSLRLLKRGRSLYVVSASIRQGVRMAGCCSPCGRSSPHGFSGQVRSVRPQPLP